MGNDGGSIPDRRDLVKARPKAEQADKANQVRARWFFCALSKVCLSLPRRSNPDVLLIPWLLASAAGAGRVV